MTAPRSSAPRLVATLGALGFASGLLLVSVFLLSQPSIEAYRRQVLEAAINRVVPGSSRRRALAVRDGRLQEAPEKETGGDGIIYAAYDEAGQQLGYAIPAEGPGFQDTIKLIYGYDPVRRMVTGMEVLESRETPGLGDKIMKDPGFLAQFLDLLVEPAVAAVKTRSGQANEVDVISGATISSQAVVRIINDANQRWRPLLQSFNAQVGEPDDGR